MDTSEIAASVGAYLGIKELAPRLLGPTVDYLGDRLKGLTELGVRNIERVFRSATIKLGSRINSPGQIPARVLRNVLNEAYFCEDALAAEYFGGILASARSQDGKDDRGAYFAALVSRLSSYQIRSHYVFYQCFKYVYNGRRLPFNHMELREQASIFIPLKSYAAAMGCMPHEGLDPYLNHACTGLVKESLISDYCAHDWSQFYRVNPPTGLESTPMLGLVSAPTQLGLELFLWCHGEGKQPVHQFFFAENDFDSLPEVHIDFTKVIKTPVAKEWGPESEPAKI